MFVLSVLVQLVRVVVSAVQLLLGSPLAWLQAHDLVPVDHRRLTLHSALPFCSALH
jgi:hypothetical protein